MAVSRFSQVFRPTEYTSPFDLGSYASLINRRQQLFDVNQNAAENKLQSIIDLPVMREVDRQHVNELVQKTTENINNLGNINYSDPTVMRQITNNINSITKDSGIINALASAQMYNADEKEIAEYKKKNTGYAMANEMPIREAQQAWLNGDLNSSYKKVGYTPHVPYDKDLTDKLKNAKEIGEISYMEIDPNDPSKQYQRIVKTGEITPERLIQIMSSTMTPEQQNQMRLDANFRWRGADDNKYTEWMGQYTMQEVGNIDNDLISINNARTAWINAGNTNTKEFDDKLATLKTKREDLQTKLNNPEALLKESQDNRDALKLYAYQKDYMGGMANLFQKKSVSMNDKVINFDESSSSNKSSNSKKTEGLDNSLTYYKAVDKDGMYVGNHTREVFEKELQTINAEITNGKKMAWTATERLDPTNALYKNKTDAEKEVIWKNWEDLYNKADFKSIPKDVAKYFDNMGMSNARADLAKQIMTKADEATKDNPFYQKARDGLLASEKLLPQSVEIPFGLYGVESGEWSTYDKKKYGKDAIKSFTQSLVNSGKFNETYLTEKIPLTDGDNTLIQDMNNYIEKSQQNKKYNSSGFKNAIEGIATAVGLPPYYGVMNPLIGSSFDPNLVPFMSYANTYKGVGNYVKQIEKDTYEKLGYINLLPTITFSADSKVQNEQINTIAKLREDYGGDSKKGEVTQLVAIQNIPNDLLRISYNFKDGQDVGKATMDVPREMIGSLGNVMPKDPYEVFQEQLRISPEGGTSPNIKNALIATNGDERLPYRIAVKPEGSFVVQFFNPDGSLIINNDIPPFSSVYDLVQHVQTIAGIYANQKKKAQ